MSSQTLDLAKVWSNSRGETSPWSTESCISVLHYLNESNNKSPISKFTDSFISLLQGDDSREPLLNLADSCQESDEADSRRARAAHALAEEPEHHQAMETIRLETSIINFYGFSHFSLISKNKDLSFLG